MNLCLKRRRGKVCTLRGGIRVIFQKVTSALRSAYARLYHHEMNGRLAGWWLADQTIEMWKVDGSIFLVYPNIHQSINQSINRVFLVTDAQRYL